MAREKWHWRRKYRSHGHGDVSNPTDGGLAARHPLQIDRFKRSSLIHLLHYFIFYTQYNIVTSDLCPLWPPPTAPPPLLLVSVGAGGSNEWTNSSNSKRASSSSISIVKLVFLGFVVFGDSYEMDDEWLIFVSPCGWFDDGVVVLFFCQDITIHTQMEGEKEICMTYERPNWSRLFCSRTSKVVTLVAGRSSTNNWHHSQRLQPTTTTTTTLTAYVLSPIKCKTLLTCATKLRINSFHNFWGENHAITLHVVGRFLPSQKLNTHHEQQRVIKKCIHTQTDIC